MRNFISAIILALACSPAVHADWFATINLPYNAPPYISQWATDSGWAIFTMTNHSNAPMPIVLKLTAKNESGEEVFHGTSLPFLFLNNSPRAYHAAEVIRWNEIEWNPQFRRICADPRRLPAGDLSVCIDVYSWEHGIGAKLAETCGKTYVNYPDIPQITGPVNGAHLSEYPVKFTWQPTSVPPGTRVHYLFTIAPVPSGVVPEGALKSNAARTMLLDTNSFVLHDYVFTLRRGSDYAWRITAVDDEGNPVTAHNGESRTGEFSFDTFNENQRLRLLASAKAIAATLLNHAEPQSGTPVVAVQTAKQALASANLEPAYTIAGRAIGVAIDSLSVSGDEMPVVNALLAKFQIDYALQTAGNRMPYAGTVSDSLLALSAAYLDELSRISAGDTKNAADSLAIIILAIRKSESEIHFARLSNATQLFLTLFSSVSGDLQRTLAQHAYDCFINYVRSVWMNGAYLTQAAVRAGAAATRVRDRRLRAELDELSSEISRAISHLATIFPADRSAGEDISALRTSLKKFKNARVVREEINAISDLLDSCSASHTTGVPSSGELTKQNSFGAAFTNAAETIDAVKPADKKRAQDIVNAIASNCRAYARDVARKPCTDDEIVQKAQSTIRDIQTLKGQNGVPPDAGVNAVQTLESNVIAPVLLHLRPMHNLALALERKGITTVAFGKPANGDFTEITGNTIMLNASIAAQPVSVLEYFISRELNENMALSLEGTYEQYLREARFLENANGQGLNSRADLSFDMRILGEQETKRILRALPSFEKEKDH